MFLLGEDILKNLKFAIKGTAVTEKIVQDEISRFKELADGIYRSVKPNLRVLNGILSAFLMRALLDWQSRGNEKFNQLDDFMISKIQCEYFVTINCCIHYIRNKLFGSSNERTR